MPERTCSVADCRIIVKARGYCPKHYARFMRHGDPLGGGSFRDKGKCSVEGCSAQVVARYLCRLHYERVKRFGAPGEAERRKAFAYSGKECGIEGCSSPMKANHMCSTHDHRARRFNLDAASLNRILQNNVCPGCGRDDQVMHIDHAHSCCPRAAKSCGRCVRGMLCADCNLVLGHANDDPARLRALADYLERP